MTRHLCVGALIAQPPCTCAIKEKSVCPYFVPPRSNSWLNRLGGAALGLALLAVAQPAEATVITRTFNFTASGSTTMSGPAAPVDPVTGSVVVTWDNAANISVDQTAGVTLNSLNLPHGAIGINYLLAGADRLIVGDTLNGVSGRHAGTTDFVAIIDGASTATPTFVGFSYNTIANTGADYTATTGNVTLGAIPEPMTLALLTPDLLGLGFAHARRLRDITPA